MLSIRLKRLLCLGTMLFMASGCGFFKSEPTIAPFISATEIALPVQASDLVYGECPFELPDDATPEAMPEVRCATLTVPEDWQKPDGSKIQLAVAIVKTASLEPKSDPLLVFIGNPGYGLFIAYVLSFLFEDIFAQRDLIIIDQRGTGFSKPALDCPELNSLSTLVNVNLSLQEANDLLVEASNNCANKVKTSGVNLPFYTTAAEAADLEALRQVLGISQWNIFSLVNGSQLALTMMRDYPQSIRSVVMDSPTPLQANPALEWGANAEMTFDRFFERCSEDAGCVKAYPNLKETFLSLLNQLDEEPIPIDVANLSGGERNKVILDSERLITLILRLLNTVNDRESLPEVPRMIYQLQAGKTEVAARLMGRYPDMLPGSAMQQWIACNEELSFITQEQVSLANENLNPHLRKYFNAQAQGSFRACEEWKAPGVPPIENQPVKSGIPTLLLAGEYDWSEPPSWAERTAQTLSQSTVVIFPGLGQVVYASSRWSVCSKQIVNAFLETPTAKPDISCASIPFKETWITLP